MYLHLIGSATEKDAKPTQVISAFLVAETALVYCLDNGKLADGMVNSGGFTLHCLETLPQLSNSQKK